VKPRATGIGWSAVFRGETPGMAVVSDLRPSTLAWDALISTPQQSSTAHPAEDIPAGVSRPFEAGVGGSGPVAGSVGTPSRRAGRELAYLAPSPLAYADAELTSPKPRRTRRRTRASRNSRVFMAGYWRERQAGGALSRRVDAAQTRPDS